MEWSISTNLLFKIQSGKFVEDRDVARRLEAAEAENDEVQSEQLTAISENGKLKEDLASKAEGKDELVAKVKEMRAAAEGIKGVLKDVESAMKAPESEVGDDEQEEAEGQTAA